MKVKNPVSQNITIFPKINHKKDLQNRLVQVHFCTQYFFSTNSSISAGVAWKRSAGGTAEQLLSLQLVWIVGSTVSHLSLENIP